MRQRRQGSPYLVRVMGGECTHQRLADHGLLRTDDPALAADHFAGLLLWVPMNKAMFHCGLQHTEAELDHYATTGVRALLAAYAMEPTES
ncbi:TetR/AcrR family transcriptional regulator C-terminal domain-containing protein [Streptomyces sp. NPDC005828]|uniref:TetR/AcrR family transcriptional regulator C-terminal domain-containing protein n=1 Tax=Streptomyces sp. NPDC005828 TaxID=3157071 RepID=UPI0034012247